MKTLFKKIGVVFLSVFMVTVLTMGVGCGSKTKKVQEFYDLVVSSQECLDIVADDIYRNWYDAIYKDKFSSNIDLAIYYAQEANSENLITIDLNEAQIKKLYKEIKDSDLSEEIKAVMSAYTDYYEFVVNVSGSFNSYSASKETLKKELASTLKDLSLEL